MSKLRELSTLVRVTKASILMIERFVDAFNFNLDCEKVPFRIQRPPSVTIPSGCSVCSRPHRTTVCVQYLRLPYDQKQQVVQQKKLCQNCLLASHPTRDCSSNPCWRCRQKHHISLHPPSPDDRPPLTRSQTTAVSQLSSKESTLTSPTLTQTEALALTPTPEHNHPQPTVHWEIHLVPLGAASRASLSEAVELDFASSLPAKVEVRRPERKAKLAQGSTFQHRIAIDLDVVSLQSIVTEAQLRRSLRWYLSFAGSGLQDWLLRTTSPVLPGTQKSELHALGTTAIRFKRSASPKHGSLEDNVTTRKLDAHAMLVGFTPPDFNKLKLAFLGRYSPLSSSPRIGCLQLKRHNAPPTTSPYLAAEDLSPTGSVDHAQYWLEVDPLVDRGALPVGGRRGQSTSARKQKLYLLANRFPRMLTLASAHSPLLHAGSPFRSKPRNMARKKFNTNRRGRPPDLNPKPVPSAEPSARRSTWATLRPWYAAVVITDATEGDWLPPGALPYPSSKQINEGRQRAWAWPILHQHLTKAGLALHARWHQPQPGDQSSRSRRQRHPRTTPKPKRSVTHPMSCSTSRRRHLKNVKC